MRTVAFRLVSPPRRLPRIPLALLLAFFLAALPTLALAHPLGNFSVNRYSRLDADPDQIVLFYVLDMAEIPTFQELPRIDSDGDGEISATENESYLSAQLATLQPNLHLTVNGRAVPLTLNSHSLEFPDGQGGLRTIRLSAEFAAPLPASGSGWEVNYRDENYPERLGWREVVVRGAEGVELLDSSAPAEDLTDALRSYPTDLLQSPLSVNEATFSFRPGTGSPTQAAPVTAAAPSAEAMPAQLVDLLESRTFGPGALALALLAAFVLGAGHALTPGHGKTIVAAYLVGARGTAKHALFLGLTTTFTHTIGVFALGFITLFLSRFILPEQLYPWLGVLSGLLVVSIGFSLFRQRLRGLFKSGRSSDTHRYGDADHDASHSDPTHPNYHTHLPPEPNGGRLSWRNLLALGVSGGLLPCPSALVLLLSAIALQRVGLGLLLIVAFSAGLAGVLTGIGILMVHARRLFERLPMQGRLLRALPVASALFITLAGVGITLQAMAQTGLLQTIVVASAGLF